MASIQDMLSSLLSTAGNHEELLGAIPAIAGAVLLARNGQVGGPLGAGLATAGGLLSLNAVNRPEKKLLVNKNTGQLEPWDTSQPLPEDATTEEMYKTLHPAQKEITPRLFSKAGGGFDWVAPGKPIPTGEMPYEKPTTPKEGKTLNPYQLGLAKSANLPPDPNTWSSDEWKRFFAVNRTDALSKQKPAQPLATPEMLVFGTGPGGVPAITGVEHPRTGGPPTVTSPVPFPSGFTPGTKGGGKGGAATVHDEEFGGYKYGFKYAKGDPSYGIGRFNDKEPGMFHHKPAKGVVWKLGGRIVNPEALTPKQREKAAAELKAKGFSIDEITGNPLG